MSGVGYRIVENARLDARNTFGVPARAPMLLEVADAATKQAAGATLMQVYTGLIYRGPALIGECVDALRRRKEAPSRGTLPPV